MSEQDTTQQAKTLGLLRWVQTTYMVFSIFLFWLLDKTIYLVWDVVANHWMMVPEAESVSIYITACSAAVASLVGWRLYTNKKFNRLTHEVLGELVKVTWPTRKEVSSHTVVVIITSIIASIILGIYDAVWSAVTDLIYKV